MKREGERREEIKKEGERREVDNTRKEAFFLKTNTLAHRPRALVSEYTCKLLSAHLMVK